ncbi:hypothetical protein N9D03_01240 [Alphaproteobacteria bacterium]|nr:hypothetical protein [Alphaproteobacteria bacterium]
MEYKTVYGLVERLAIKPTEGSQLAVFLTQLENKRDNSDTSNAQEGSATTELTEDSDQEIMGRLKRLQIITLTKPILGLSIRAQTPQELNEAKRAGVESFINIPDEISRKLNSLETALEASLKDFTEIKDTDAEELCKKFNLVVPPNGLELSIVFTLVVAASAVLAFVILKAEDMLNSPEAYWGFLVAGILILLGINAVIMTLVKLLRFRKNRDSIIIEAKRIFVENANLKYSKFKAKVDNESFQIQNRAYSQGAKLKLKEIGREEQSIRESLNA